MGKNPPANAGEVRDADSVPGSGRSPGEGNGKHSSILAWRIPMDRGAWRAIVHRLSKGRTRLKQLSMHAGYLVSELNLNFFNIYFYLFGCSGP